MAALHIPHWNYNEKVKKSLEHMSKLLRFSYYIYKWNTLIKSDKKLYIYASHNSDNSGMLLWQQFDWSPVKLSNDSLSACNSAC